VERENHERPLPDGLPGFLPRFAELMAVDIVPIWVKPGLIGRVKHPAGRGRPTARVIAGFQGRRNLTRLSALWANEQTCCCRPVLCSHMRR
jgi:hypothetical protein